MKVRNENQKCSATEESVKKNSNNKNHKSEKIQKSQNLEKTKISKDSNYHDIYNSNHRKCKSGKRRKTGASVLCTMDDASCFLDIRLGLKTSVHEKHVSVKSTATGCDVTSCATTLQGFNKHASSRREPVSDSRGVPRCTAKISKNLRLLTCVDHSTRAIHHTRIQ